MIKTELKMAQYILNNKGVHYTDISKEFNISRPTITKYLNSLSELVSKYNLELNRSKVSGIFFIGDTKKFEKLLNENYQDVIPDSPEERQMYIVANLIFSKSKVSINKLADHLYVSRRTIESDLNKVRIFIANYGGSLENNNGTLNVVLPEKIKYPFLIEVVHKFSDNNESAMGERKNIIPSILNKYIKKEETKKVVDLVNNFLKQQKYKLTDYEYETLVIYLILQIPLSSNNIQKIQISDKLEEETVKLSNNYFYLFNKKLNSGQLIFLNNFILLIKLENHKDITNDKDFPNLKYDIKKYINDYDSQLIEGLYQHLSGALRRNKFGMNASNPYTEQIKQKFPLSFEEALSLIKKLDKKFDTDLSEDEVAFTALHFESYFERKKTPDAPVNAVIVCNTGIGTSRLLEEKINQEMSDKISINRILRSHELITSKINEDLIISTVPLKDISNEFVLVSPFLTNEDKSNIESRIQVINANSESFNYFSKLFHQELIFIENKKIDYISAINKVAEETVKNKYAIDKIAAAAIKREDLSSTAVENIALPHADVKYVSLPFIAVMISQKGISWMGENVKVLFFMGMNDQTRLYIRKIYHYLNEIIEDKEKIYKLERAKSKQEVMSILMGDK